MRTRFEWESVILRATDLGFEIRAVAQLGFPAAERWSTSWTLPSTDLPSEIRGTPG